MRHLLAVLCMATVSLASVLSTSEHYNDAVVVDMLISSMYSGCNVTIEDGCYYCAWPGVWYSQSDDQDVGRLTACLNAVGMVSADTEWSSDKVIIGFEGSVAYWMYTSCCRQIVQMATSGFYTDTQLGAYILSNLYVFNY